MSSTLAALMSYGGIGLSSSALDLISAEKSVVFEF